MHVAITGASSGIGEALAREFAATGAVITLIARRKENLERISAGLGVRTFTQSVDLSDTRQATVWIEEAEKALGPIDVLINNAGAQIVAPFDETNPDEGDKTVALNFLTPARILRALVPKMLARGNGTVVNVSSMAAVAQNPGMFYYNAGKAGMGAASESLRNELRGTGVHVVTVYPGPIHTAMANMSFEKHEMKPGKIPTGTPAGIARAIRKAVEKKKARVVYPPFYRLGFALPNLARYVTAFSRPPFLKKFENWKPSKTP